MKISKRTREEAAVMGLDEALAWVAGLPESQSIDGFYISADDDRHDHERLYCVEHARRMVDRLTQRRKVQHYYSGCWAGSDHVEYCRICRVLLNVGGLTSYGVDSALALTEEDPKACRCTPGELEMSARAMVKDDPRWELWLYHANRLRDERNLAIVVALAAAERGRGP